MESRTIAFLLGILLLQQFSVLPHALWALPLLLALFFFHFVHFSLPFPWQKPSVVSIAWLLAGFLWAWFRASMLLSSGLPVELEGQDIVIEGVVSSLPEADERKIRFVLDVEKAINNEGQTLSLDRVRLSWYKKYPTIKPGEQWRFTVRLKRPWGMMNPGSFDYERWLFQQGIRATGRC